MSVEIQITSNNSGQKCFKLPSEKECNLEQLNMEIYPKWAALQSHKCNNCPLSSKESKWCPAAVKIVDIAKSFPELTSFEHVVFELKKDDYTFKETITAQDALIQLIFNSIGICACPEIQPETWGRDYFHPRYDLKGVLFKRIVLKLLAYHIGENKGRSMSKYLSKQASLVSMLEKMTKRIENAMTENQENIQHTIVILHGILRMLNEGYEEFILDEIESNFIGYK